MFKIIFVFFLTLKTFASQPEPFALITIPKSGSHLLIKALHYMTGLSPDWHTDPPDAAQQFHESHFPFTHFCLSPLLFHYYANSPIKQIIGIRDLRDVCVSIVYQIRKGIWPEFMKNRFKQARFQKLSFDEQLLFVIEQEYDIHPPWIQIQMGIRKVAEQAVLMMANPNVLLCRYEELVGPQGGGTEQAQKTLLCEISNHIGVSEQHIAELIPFLYGNENNPFGRNEFSEYQSTFREGKIGSWKSAFKEIHKDVFKKRLGQALIALGYEKNNSW